MIDSHELLPNRYYWAKARAGGDVEVVFVSTIFGDAWEYWTIARVGREDHAMPDSFVFYREVAKPELLTFQELMNDAT